MLIFITGTSCDGKECLYGSRCKNGKCACPTQCDSDKYEPVCGSDGHTVKIMINLDNRMIENEIFSVLFTLKCYSSNIHIILVFQ